MGKAIDFSYLKIGNVSVTDKFICESHKNSTRRKWKCICSCNKVVWLYTYQLRQNKYIISCGCLYPKLSVGEACYKWLYRDYKSKAEKRKLEFRISFIYFKQLVSRNCTYCGIKPANKIGKYSGRGPTRCNGDILCNGIDRIDNNKGYTVDNCVTCCSVCNRAKYTMSQEDFIEWIKRAYEYLCI